MRFTRLRRFAAVLPAVLLLLPLALASQSRGLRQIRAEDMRGWLELLSSRELQGRNAPSASYDVAARYVALEAARIGLKPLLPGGEWMQAVPMEASSLSPARTRLRLVAPGVETTFAFPQAFGLSPRAAPEGTVSGGLVFVPLPSTMPASEIDKALAALPVSWSGKIALTVVPTAQAAGGSAPASITPAMVLTRFLRSQGAAGLLTVIAPDREAGMTASGTGFGAGERLRFPSLDTAVPAAAPASPAPAPPAPFLQAELRHETAAAILGLSKAEIGALFTAPAAAVAAREIPGRTLELEARFDVRATAAANVVGWVEGSDPKLKGEYVVLSAHVDGLGLREGKVMAGADDNGSGTAGLLSLAKAVVAERPRRSVVFLWTTAEEDGLVGAYHFVQHCPVPVEKISANLNLDMISRNDPGMIYLIGSNKLSSGLDASLRAQNERSARFKLDYAYESPQHPDRFFFRSDQYPFIRYGIPGVWIFCGTTPDYHQETDTLDRADLAKAEKAARLVYLAAWDIANRPGLLPLDLNPDVTARGPHNMRVNWSRPAAPAAKR